MSYKMLFLIAMTACCGCATKPAVHDVVLNLPISAHDACIPLKTNVYVKVVDGRHYWVDDPKGPSVTVPSNTTAIGINCEEMGPRPPGCENARWDMFMNSQPFLVDLTGAPSYTLECRITDSETGEDHIEVFVTKPYQGQLKPAPRQKNPL